MQPFSKSSTCLRLVGIVVCLVLLDPVQARAKSGAFDDDTWDNWDNEDSMELPSPVGRTIVNETSDHSNHAHHLSPPVLAAAGTAGAPAISGNSFNEGMQGGNFAAYNESCSPTGKSCARGQNLLCSETDGTGRCICTNDHVYVRQTETCWVIMRSDQESCAHDVQCQAGKWAALSRCNKHSARCECFDFETNGNRSMTINDGICYIKKDIGDLCNNHDECDKTILGGAYCQDGDHQSSSGGSYKGSCQCRDTHLYWEPFKACLQRATKLNDNCKISEQCTQGSLGHLSRCAGSGYCECYTARNGTELVYYEKLHKCFKSKQYNDTCTDADQCRASLGPDVECGATAENEEPVCHCPQGKVCRNAGFSTLLASPIFTIALAVVVGVFTTMKGL